jgi:hypothetical protein
MRTTSMSRSFSSSSQRSPATRRTSDSAAARPLPDTQRSFFETAFGQDFSQVRVHTDRAAQTLAGAMGAKAVTDGEDIAFAPGRYAPESSAGRTLLAHELAHVTQQRQGGGAPAAAEHHARSAAQTVAGGGQVDAASLGGADPGLHCDPDDQPADTPWKPGEPLPQFKLSTPGLLDWSKLREPFTARGLQMSLRDADSIEQESKRIVQQLQFFGIGPSFKLNYGLGTLTYDDVLNMSLGVQLDNQLGREHPNSFDRFNADWKLAHPEALQTPIVPLFSRKF